MDLQNATNYKLYKCRSLLACDSGGTVYDTSKRCDDSNLIGSQQNKNEKQSESGQSDSIIYIIGTRSKYKSENRSLVDLTTHLDDDEFNDYEMNSNMSYEPENEVVLVRDEDRIEYSDVEKQHCNINKNLVYIPNENNNNEDVSNIIDQILEKDDTFIFQDSDLNYIDNTDDTTRKDTSSTERDTTYEQEETSSQFLSTLSQSKTDSSDLDYLSTHETTEYEYDLSIKAGIELSKIHTHKRKQVYNVKDDSFTELVDDDKDVLNKNFSHNTKSKKKKLIYNKENQKEKLQNYKRNPFANLRMSSILKETKKKTIKKNKNQCREQKKESVISCNYENFASNSSNSNDGEVLIYKRRPYQIDYFSSFNSKDDVLQEIGAVIHLNSDLSNADYLEYVQPRERIVESDMDKLLSPTIENEFSETIQTCKVTQTLVKEKLGQIDCNGNEVDFEDIQRMSILKSILSPNQIAERELFLKSAYARKLGYENYFNTSNDSLINEILFDGTLTYEEINLEINFIKSVETYPKENLLSNKLFNSVSCTLLESLNELHRFGGFIEENCEEEKLNHTDDDSDAILTSDESIRFSEADSFQRKETLLSLTQELKVKEENQINSNFTFNFSNKSNLLGLDFQSRCTSLEHLNSTNNDTKRSCAPLIIKMKRVNDENNEYVIDDSSRQSMEIIEKKTTPIVKNIDSFKYECYDCSEKFRTKRILKNHVSECHRGPYDMECEICHAKFRKSSAHKKHQPWCEKSVIHKCLICNKVYCYRGSLVKHLKTHQH